MKSIISTTILLLIALVNMSSAMATPGDGLPFDIKGESVDHVVPKGWTLAWMSGGADGVYIMEFIPESEDINAWCKGYLAIARSPYPSEDVMAKLRKGGVDISAAAASQHNDEAREGCSGSFRPMSGRTKKYGGAVFAVTGGFCDKYASPAPFGEGAVFAIVEGKSYLFRIQYSWRPVSATENEKLPWRIQPDVVSSYLKAITESTLCGGPDEPTCKVYYRTNGDGGN